MSNARKPAKVDLDCPIAARAASGAVRPTPKFRRRNAGPSRRNATPPPLARRHGPVTRLTPGAIPADLPARRVVFPAAPDVPLDDNGSDTEPEEIPLDKDDRSVIDEAAVVLDACDFRTRSVAESVTVLAEGLGVDDRTAARTFFATVRGQLRKTLDAADALATAVDVLHAYLVDQDWI
jgi:hypothetical protein